MNAYRRSNFVMFFIALVLALGSTTHCYAQSQAPAGSNSTLAIPVNSSSITEKSVAILNAQGVKQSETKYTLQGVSNFSESTSGTVLTLGGEKTGLLKRGDELFQAQVQGDSLIVAQQPRQAHEQGTCRSALHGAEEVEQFEEIYRQRTSTIPQRTVALNVVREVEVLAVASGDFIEGRSEEEAIDDIIFAVEGANVYYQPLGLQFRLVAIQVHTPGISDPYDFAAQSQNAITMLDRLRAQWLFRPSPARDLTVVFAASSFNKVYGLAYPRASCIMPEFSYSFVSKGGATGPGSRASLASTFAHEMGHQVGMSHDSTVTALGPTVMWPLFSSFPAGFSQFSISEYQAHDSNGGTSCFAQRQSATDATQHTIVPGGLLELSVKEGELLKVKFAEKIGGLSTFFILENKPAGAVFDPSTGAFSYTADGGVVTPQEHFRDFVMNLSVFGSSEQAMQVRLRVFNENQAPRIDFSTPEIIEVPLAKAVSVNISAKDIDAPFDTALLTLKNAAAVRRYPGRPAVVINGSLGLLTWTPSQVGNYPFSFVAQDAAGATFVRELLVKVVAGNLAPVIDVPDQISIQGSSTSFEINASDPEGAPLALRVTGMQPGVIVERFGTMWRVDYSNAMSAGKKEEELKVLVSDGVRSTAVSVMVSVDGLPTEQKYPWPGAPATVPVDVAQELFFYDGISGMWQQKSCQGELEDFYQFGGLVGDMPLVFEEKGVRYPALFRLINGRGVFLVKRKEEVSLYAHGQAGDYPVLADFDGDGISDFAVYRPASGQWLIDFSLLAPQVLDDMSIWLGYSVTPFAKDVDADGLDDRVLVVRDENGKVFADIRLANGKQLVIGIADVGIISGAEPIVADIDSDGRADLVVRSTDGSLHGLRSSTVVPFVQEQAATNARVVHTGCNLGDFGGLVTLGRYIILAGNEFPFDESNPEFIGELLELYQLRQRGGLSSRPSTDVDGDYKSDLTVFRPNASRGLANWFSSRSASDSYMSPWVYADNAQPVAFGYEPQRGMSLVHFEDGVWHFFGSQYLEHDVVWGEPGDIPVAADYNGDGFRDLGVYRPSDGTWWIAYGPSFLPAVKIEFGAPGDKPVPADYDGDGTVDLAVYRPADGLWIVRYGDSGVEIRRFGLPGDIPVPGDYLGEGRAQIAVWRPSTGYWYLMRENREVVARQWGLPGDVPIALDRDGNGREELSVWRPNTGSWYSRQIADASDQVSLSAYGLPGDLVLGPVWAPQLEDETQILND